VYVRKVYVLLYLVEFVNATNSIVRQHERTSFHTELTYNKDRRSMKKGEGELILQTAVSRLTWQFLSRAVHKITYALVVRVNAPHMCAFHSYFYRTCLAVSDDTRGKTSGGGRLPRCVDSPREEAVYVLQELRLSAGGIAYDADVQITCTDYSDSSYGHIVDRELLAQLFVWTHICIQATSY
jgi:hypothetical protein